MVREYRQIKRAEALQNTRERIIQATMELHDQQGVASTTFTDIAERAGLGPATVYRHFNSLSELIQACGMHVWQMIRPPTPDTSATVFEGATTRDERLQRLIDELDQFYERGGIPLRRAAQDRDRVPELDGFLNAVEAGLESLIRNALFGEQDNEVLVRAVCAVTSLTVWTDLKRTGLSGEALVSLKLRLLKCTTSASKQNVEA